MSESTPIRVLLVDDHAVVRSGLSAFLLVFDDLEQVGEAGDGEDDFHVTEALEKLAWLHHRIGQPEKAYKYELRIRKLQKARSRTEYWDDPEEHPPLRRLIHVHPTSEERSSHDGGEPS